jgi:serine/threonine protein phosphatase 1
MATRTLVIADIHGALKALVQVLQRSEYDLKKDNLIFLGDYVDGWSQSAEVVDFIIGLKEKAKFEMRHPDSVICLEGNHDQWLREFLIYGTIPQGWLENGGKTTLRSYTSFWEENGKSSESLDSHRSFFKYLHPYYVDNKNRAFVHAGCDREKGVAGTLPYLRVWDRRMWAQVLSGAKVEAHNELFIGHTTTTAMKLKRHLREYELQTDKSEGITIPVNRQNVWNLDTGCGWDGKLTVLDVDTKEYWQSDLVSELYSGERGRM